MPPGGSHRRPSGVSSPGDAKEITRGERRDEAEHLSSTTPGARAAGLGGGATAGFRGHVGWCTGGRRRDVALCRRARHPRPLSGHPRAHCLPQPHKGQPHRWFPTTCVAPRPRRGGSPRPSCAPRASAVWSHLVCDREFRHSPKALLQDRSETAFPFFALAWPPARTSGRPRVRVRRRERWRTSSPLTASPYSSLVMPASRTRSSRWRVRPPPRSRPKTPPPSLRGLCAPAGLEAAPIPHLTRRL